MNTISSLDSRHKNKDRAFFQSRAPDKLHYHEGIPGLVWGLVRCSNANPSFASLFTSGILIALWVPRIYIYIYTYDNKVITKLTRTPTSLAVKCQLGNSLGFPRRLKCKRTNNITSPIGSNWFILQRSGLSRGCRM